MNFIDFLKNPVVFYTALFAFVMAVLFDFYTRMRKVKNDDNSQIHGRMEKTLMHFKEQDTHKRITNDQYQEITGVSHATATRDLQQLEEFGFLEQKGTGRGVYYRLTKK